MTGHQILRKKYQTAQKRLLLLDYDGTLAEFKTIPSAAKPTHRLLRVLQNLCQDNRNTVAIISGRDHQTLEAWLGHLPVTLVAEHGYLVKQPGRRWYAPIEVNDGWKNNVIPAMHTSTIVVSDSFIEEKSAALVWHYRASADQAAAAAAAERLTQTLAPAAKRLGLVVVPGNKIVEVKPKDIDKGRTVAAWTNHHTWDFILAAGDDTTDEDMFAAMPDQAFTIKVGEGASGAKLRLRTPTALLDLLEKLTAHENLI